MARKIARKLRQYSVHGFINPSDQDGLVIDYSDFFEEMKDSKSSEFSFKLGSETVAMSTVEDLQEYRAFLFVRGSESSITIFNERTGVTEEANLPDDYIAVTATWLIWQKDTRFVFVESNRPGVGYTAIEKYFTAYGKEILNHPNFTFDLNPVPGPEFEKQIGRFTRIREVSVVLNRPNHVWESAHLLIGDASESDAQTIELSARAPRKQTLSKIKGIVPRVIQYAAEKITGLKDARVYGDMPGTVGEQTVSLKKSQVVASASIDSESDPSQNLIAYRDALMELDREGLPAKDQL
ncbi:MAG: hypothetical protein Q4F10_11445 [Corynebacterium glutamicum]|nr:hypothetical protein [Corynebacterium glutamicum]